MNLKTISRANGIVYIALGIAFALYGPLMINFFGVLEVPGSTGESYWFTASFARLYGAALFGFGFVLWAVSHPAGQFNRAERQKMSFGLLLTHLIGLMVAFTQQFSIWIKPFGWAVVGLYLLFSVAYILIMVTDRSKDG